MYVDDPEIEIVVSDTPSICGDHLASIRTVAGVGSLDEAVAIMPVYAFSVIGLAREDLVPVTEALLGMGAELMLAPEPRFDCWSVVVALPGVTKWSGVLAYCASKGVRPDEVLAVGDGDNDVAMLTHAAIGVAVRDGTEPSVSTLAEAGVGSVSLS